MTGELAIAISWSAGLSPLENPLSLGLRKLLTSPLVERFSPTSQPGNMQLPGVSLLSYGLHKVSLLIRGTATQPPTVPLYLLYYFTPGEESFQEKEILFQRNGLCSWYLNELGDLLML